MTILRLAKIVFDRPEDCPYMVPKPDERYCSIVRTGCIGIGNCPLERVWQK